MRKKKLIIVGLYKPIPDRNFSMLIFKEENGNRKLHLKIGGFETDAILMVLEGIKPTRPLIYDLFRKVCNFGYIIMHEVLIYKLEKDIYYSRIAFSNEGEEIELNVHPVMRLLWLCVSTRPSIHMSLSLEKQSVNTISRMRLRKVKRV